MSVSSTFSYIPPDRTDAIATELMQTRREYTPWISKEIVDELHGMENNLAGIGIAINEIKGDSLDEQAKSELLGKIEYFREEIFGCTFDINQMNSETACAKIVSRLQKTLGINELTLLRKKYIAMALNQPFLFWLTMEETF